MQEPPHNRRKFARIPLDARVTIVVAGVDARHRLLVENLGAGGLFIRTERPKTVGTKVRFEFLVRDGGSTIAGTGVVRWVNKGPEGPPGMGIQFLELNEEGKREILEILRQKKARADD